MKRAELEAEKRRAYALLLEARADLREAEMVWGAWTQKEAGRVSECQRAYDALCQEEAE